MQFTIKKETFVKALAKITPFTVNRTTLPILSHVLLSAHNGGLEFSATDLQVGACSTYEAEAVKAGSIAVNAKKLYEIVKELPNEEVIFSTKENDWAEIVCGKARFNIVGLPADDFPHLNLGSGEAFSIGSDLLNDMIAKTSHAICYDETKANLNGAYLKFDAKEETITMVTTDGHRLGYCKKPLTGITPEALTEGVILPQKGVHELKKLADENAAGEIKLSFESNNVVARAGNTVMSMRLIEGNFPDYQKVIPAANNAVVTIDRAKLLSAMKRMGLLSTEKAKGVSLEVRKDQIVMSARTPEFGDCTEDVEVGYAGSDFSINLNPKYLMEFAAVVPDNSVEMKFKDALTPVVMKAAANDDCLAIIMPMRMN